MDSFSLDLPRRSTARPIPPSPFSLKDKLLGMSVSPASAHSLSSDCTDANDLDELDEQEIWGVEASSVENKSDVEVGKAQASRPPRITSGGRISGARSGTSEGRSSLKEGSPVWVSPGGRGLSSISGFSSQHNGTRNPTGRVLGNDATSRRIPVASRMIPRLASQETDPRKGMLEDGSGRGIPQSAPVNIPDWSKLDNSGRQKGRRNVTDDRELDDEEEERLPPHEFLAREYARSQTPFFSVFEGAGRTLKGRDLSRVRNAVLTCTGFLE